MGATPVTAQPVFSESIILPVFMVIIIFIEILDRMVAMTKIELNKQGSDDFGNDPPYLARPRRKALSTQNSGRSNAI
jgi:hypothetical protein